MLSTNLSPATRWGVNLVLLLCGAIALRLGETIFIPTILALLLTAMLWPAAYWLHVEGVPLVLPTLKPKLPFLGFFITRWRMSWSFACMVVVSGLISLALLMTVGFGLAVVKMTQDIPTGKIVEERTLPTGEHVVETDQERVYKDLRRKIAQVVPWELPPDVLPADPKQSTLYQSITDLANPEKGYILSFLTKVSNVAQSWIWQWILIMFILLFLLVEGRMLSRRVVEIFGPGTDTQRQALNVLREMSNQVRTYLVCRTLINVVMASGVAVVYYVVGLKQPWTWGMLTIILWYIPYLGPMAAGIPPVIDAFVTCETAWAALGLLVFYSIVVIVEGYVVFPLVMGHSMELNATTVMLACMFWELIWGMSGLFLAMPLMAAVKAVCTYVPGWQPWANLMGTKEAEIAFQTDPLKVVDQVAGRDMLDGKPISKLETPESRVETNEFASRLE